MKQETGRRKALRCQKPKQQHTREANPVPHLGILDHRPSSQTSNKSLQPGLDSRADLPFVTRIQSILVFEM